MTLSAGLQSLDTPTKEASPGLNSKVAAPGRAAPTRCPPTRSIRTGNRS